MGPVRTEKKKKGMVRTEKSEGGDSLERAGTGLDLLERSEISSTQKERKKKPGILTFVGSTAASTSAVAALSMQPLGLTCAYVKIFEECYLSII